MRSLLFLLTWARAGSESAATLAVRIAPVLRKVRRVTGEVEKEGDFVFIVVAGHDAPTVGGHKQKEERVRSEKFAAHGRPFEWRKRENGWPFGMFLTLTQLCTRSPRKTLWCQRIA